MTFEEYATSKGASRQNMGDAALHRSSRTKSYAIHHRQVMAQASKDQQLIDYRTELRKEFEKLVDSGLIRQPTRIEKLLRSAQGHPDNEATQAARRILDKQEVMW